VKLVIRPQASALKFHKLLEGAPKRLDEAAMRSAEMFVDAVRDDVVRGIRQQGFALVGLTKAYLAWKGKHGLSVGVLEATRGYQRALRTVKVGRGYGIEVRGNSKLTGVPYAIVAKGLERGTKTMKARPHWTPALRAAEKRFGLVGRTVSNVVFKE
jgi:hypothetical protein